MIAGLGVILYLIAWVVWLVSYVNVGEEWRKKSKLYVLCAVGNFVLAAIMFYSGSMMALFVAILAGACFIAAEAGAYAAEKKAQAAGSGGAPESEN